MPEAIRLRLENQASFMKWLDIIQKARKFGQTPEEKKPDPKKAFELSAINEVDESAYN